MNKKGFTLVELLATISIMAIVMLFVMPSALKLKDQNDLKTYANYEKVMAEYAELYAGTLTKMTLTELETAGLKGVSSNCDGYVLINRSVTPNTYTPYISCDDKYQTTGYDVTNLS